MNHCTYKVFSHDLRVGYNVYLSYRHPRCAILPTHYHRYTVAKFIDPGVGDKVMEERWSNRTYRVPVLLCLLSTCVVF
jgi:hypothetical protein